MARKTKDLPVFPSSAHKDAHDALVMMGTPTEEAQKLIGAIQGHDSGQILGQALAARRRQNARVAPAPGAPQGAVPLNAPSATQSAATAAVAPVMTGTMRPSQTPPSATPYATWGAASGTAPPPAPIAKKPSMLRAFTPTRKAERPPAPSAPEPQGTVTTVGPEGTPVQTPVPRVPGPEGVQLAQKPKVPFNMLRAFTPQPAPMTQAPSAPTAAPPPPSAPRPPQAAGTVPEISTLEEYAKLAPGTLFRWMGEGAHRGRLFRAHVNPTAPRTQVFGKAPPA